MSWEQRIMMKTQSGSLKSYDAFIASLVTFHSGTIQVAADLAEMSPPVAFVLDGWSCRRFKFACAALSFKIFSASHPEHLPPFSISSSFVLPVVLLPSFSFTKHIFGAIFSAYFSQSFDRILLILFLSPPLSGNFSLSLSAHRYGSTRSSVQISSKCTT